MVKNEIKALVDQWENGKNDAFDALFHSVVVSLGLVAALAETFTEAGDALERELELSDEHDGIIELPSGEVGDRFTDWLAANAPEKIDPVIEIKITPNRPDALGIRGVARDLAGERMVTSDAHAGGSRRSPRICPGRPGGGVAPTAS